MKMPGPKPPVVKLGSRLQELLEKINRQQTAAQRLIGRVRIILNASKELNNSQIAKLLNSNLNTVRTWRGRWLAAEERLFNGVKEGLKIPLAKSLSTPFALNHFEKEGGAIPNRLGKEL